MEKKYAGPGAGMLNRILGGKVRDKHGKYGRRKKKYMRGMGRGMWTQKEVPEAGMLDRILRGKVWNKTGSTWN